jgi:4-diphosphocytidyl-2-C-methyl-D-erythritol kinase
VHKEVAGSAGVGKSLKLLAPAKINLSLRILGRRSDGYHDLDTVMQKLDLCDLVTVSIIDEPGIILHCPDSDLPEDSGNIVFRAALAFLAACADKGAGISITLEKRIPVAAGLGGGSSDAGAVLLGLNRLLEAGFSTAELIEIARPLGADVPFFVTNYGAVRAEGIGDRMTDVPSLRDCTIVLVNPGVAVSTRWAYEKYALTAAGKDSKIKNFSEKVDRDYFLSTGVNDLERVTIARYPEIAALKRDLLDLGAAFALMSGSGPTLFGVFPDEGGAVSPLVPQAVRALQQQKNVKVFVTQPV